MIEDTDGKPKIGPSAVMLGVRAGPKVPPADVLVSLPDDFIRHGHGLSVAPEDPSLLPSFRRPPEVNGGTGKYPLWTIKSDLLGPELEFFFDRPPGHGLIQPGRKMTLRDFETALAMTRDRWVKYNPLVASES